MPDISKREQKALQVENIIKGKRTRPRKNAEPEEEATDTVPDDLQRTTVSKPTGARQKKQRAPATPAVSIDGIIREFIEKMQKNGTPPNVEQEKVLRECC